MDAKKKSSVFWSAEYDWVCVRPDSTHRVRSPSNVCVSVEQDDVVLVTGRGSSTIHLCIHGGGHSTDRAALHTATMNWWHTTTTNCMVSCQMISIGVQFEGLF